MESYIPRVERMAQLNTKLLIIIFTAFFAVILALILIPSSIITTNQPVNYGVSLDKPLFKEKVRSAPGKKNVKIIGPYGEYSKTIFVWPFSNNKISVNDFEKQIRIDQIAENKLSEMGFPNSSISDCTSIEEYIFVCQSDQLSSVRPVEVKYSNFEWFTNININNVTNPLVKQKFNEIYSRNDQL